MADATPIKPLADRRHPQTRLILPTCLVWILALTAGLSITTRGASASASLQASLEPQTVALGSTAVLELRFVNCTPTSIPEIPRVPGLDIRYFSQGRETTIINTTVQETHRLSYQIRPSAVGTFTIPSISTVIDGRRLSSQPVVLTVAKTDPSVAQIAFLTLAFPKDRFYVGEATTAEIYLHTRGGEVVRLPGLSADGAVVGTNVPISQQAVQITTNNTIYYRFGWKVPVTFVKAGNLRFSAENCEIQVRFRGQRSRDLFSFPSLLGNIETKRFTLGSQPVAVSVRPLPTSGVPADFTGAVGRFTLAADLTTTNVNAGDPLTLTVRLSGLGNLEALRWAAPDSWPGLKTYEPTSQLQVSDSLGQTGTQRIEQVLVPESTATRSIPAIHFSFFDPIDESYRSLTHPGFELNVRPSTTVAAQPLLARPNDSDEVEQTADIVHVKSRPGVLAMTAPPLVFRPWFLFLQGLPILVWIIALCRRKQVDRLAANPREIRRRQVAARVKQGLITLRAHAQANAVEEFHSELFRLLQEQLGERLDLPASSITGEIVDHQLRAANTDPALANAVEELFGQCDQARYARKAASEALQTLLSQAEGVLCQLQQWETRHDA